MDLYVDDHPVRADLILDGTVGECVERIRADAAARAHIVTGLRCDGVDVVGDELNRALARPLADVERLDIQTGSPAVLVVDVLEQALQLLDASLADVAAVVNHLAAGQTSKGMQRLAEVVRQWLQVNDAIGKSLSMLRINPDELTVAGGSAAQAILAPREWLTQIKCVVEAGDHVLLADILQYEIDGAIQRWRCLIEAVLARARSVGETPI